ncbi:MAG TPA: acyltransferase domain-containing protein, partial [Mycobacteriales bacterium]|nr:acyltransferase domain-containing protein [Mycobacteriales bacterium]
MASIEHIRRQLELPPEATGDLIRLDSIGPPPSPAAVPDERTAESLLSRMTVGPSDVREILAARPDRTHAPEHWWLLQCCCHELQLDMGGTGTLSGWPAIPGAAGRWLYVWVFLCTADQLRKYYARKGIPEEVAWATMTELGTQL